MTLTTLLFISLTGCKKWRAVETTADLDIGVENPSNVVVPNEVARMMKNFERVHFETDSSALDETSKTALAKNARIMMDHPDITIEIQGHCDERGTTEYNLALGDRRANAVREYLIQQGVAPSRIVTLSLGEEAPLAMGAEEDAWSQNRRAEFRITWDEGTVAMGTIQ